MNSQHPEGLEEGLAQSAAGEVSDLGSFAKYAEAKELLRDFMEEVPYTIQCKLFDLSGCSSEDYSREFGGFRPRAEKIAEALFAKDGWRAVLVATNGNRPYAADLAGTFVHSAVRTLEKILLELDGESATSTNAGYYNSVARDLAEVIFGDIWGIPADVLEEISNSVVVRELTLEDRLPGEVFELSEKDKDSVLNSENYELFTIVEKDGEKYPVPMRPDIIGSYLENGFGYLLQQVEGRFRYIGIEEGEDDYFGRIYSSRREALQEALSDWRENGMGDDWALWTRQLVEDAEAPAPAIDPKTIEVFLRGSEAAASLTNAQIAELAGGLSELVSEGLKG